MIRLGTSGLSDCEDCITLADNFNNLFQVGFDLRDLEWSDAKALYKGLKSAQLHCNMCMERLEWSPLPPDFAVFQHSVPAVSRALEAVSKTFEQELPFIGLLTEEQYRALENNRQQEDLKKSRLPNSNSFFFRLSSKGDSVTIVRKDGKRVAVFPKSSSQTWELQTLPPTYRDSLFDIAKVITRDGFSYADEYPIEFWKSDGS